MNICDCKNDAETCASLIEDATSEFSSPEGKRRALLSLTKLAGATEPPIDIETEEDLPTWEARLQTEMHWIDRLLQPAMNEAGRIGYIIAWVLGVPAWLLFIVFLFRGH